jgi:hypothetical protein
VETEINLVAPVQVSQAEDCVLSGPVGRQWHTSELLAVLTEREITSGMKLDKYVLDHVLRKSGVLSSLGRMIWMQTQTGAESTSNRLDLRQAAISLLSDAGRPLSTIEIKQGITALRGAHYLPIVGDAVQSGAVRTLANDAR